MKTNALRKQKGFTIIEVVLVLAIAGLIFLIVFLALPQLQKSRRDTQRRNDAGRMISALESYASSNDGAYPALADVSTAISNYGGTFKDPTTGSSYTFQGTAPTTAGQIQYATGQKCKGSGFDPDGGSARDIAMIMKLENGVYCRGNQ